MIELEFKVWLERFSSTHYPSQMYPANRAGVRDVRFGYSMNPGENPPILANLGSDIVTGLGSVFRKSMGSGFPTFGSGYRNYFDELTSSFRDGKNYVVIHEVPYNAEDDDDDYGQPNLKKLTKNLLHSTRNRADIAQEAQRFGINIRNNPQTVYEPSDKGQDYIKIIFRFHPPEKLSSRVAVHK